MIPVSAAKILEFPAISTPRPFVVISDLAGGAASVKIMPMRIHELAREAALVHSAASVLSWDEETCLPAAAAAHRAQQLSWLSARAHEMTTSDEWLRAIEEAEASAASGDAADRANLGETRRQFERARRIPVDLVGRESAAASAAKHAWSEARSRSDFRIFAPHLATLLEFARRKADLWGYREEPYDALIEGYERRATASSVGKLFDAVKPDLVSIAAGAVARSKERCRPLPRGPYAPEDQARLNALVAKSLGFDFEAGRIDTSTHPFCTTLGPCDVRLTTRYDPDDFTSSLFGVLHETGHGLYEQGLPQQQFGMPAGSAVSLGIHESQSRLWENHVGRSRAFWEHWLPLAAGLFPQLASCGVEDILGHVRRAEFSQIRVEADEATYDLHILLRFGIERGMLSGDIAVKDVPSAWNETFEALLGFRPENDAAGCLQDIHWSMGGIGYFPTYTLGNIHAAALFRTACAQTEIRDACDRAEYGPLLAWLREHIHRHGSLLDPDELVLRATGSPPSADAYLEHLRQRYL